MLVFFVNRFLRRACAHLLFVVDRKDLDYQTMKEYDRFEKGSANSNTSTAVLKRQLEDSNSRIIITTIQKLSTFVSKNKGHEIYQKHIVIIFDECHRSQYGVFAENLMTLLPDASRIGFTGTPLLSSDNLTARTFGGYISVYDFQRAVEDGATVPLL